MIERICLDKDPSEALEFILKHVSPKIEKKIPCLAGDLMRTQP